MRRAGPGDERGRRAIGSLSVLGGGAICAVALDLVPIDESSLHAPRAVLFLAGLVVLVAGVMALGGPDSRHNDLLAAALLLSMAAAGAWVALFAPGEGFSGGVPLLPRGTNVLLARIVFGLGAVATFLVAVWAFRRWLMRRR